MFEFIQRFFGKPTSSATAKERLRLVLLSDHLSLAPDVVEALKHDLIEVISRYVDVDASNCDVTFEQREKQVAMLANIPILGMRARPKPPAPPPAPDPVPAPAVATASPPSPAPVTPVAVAPAAAHSSTPAAAPQTQAHAGWIIQVGAFAAEGEAKQRLSTVQTRASKFLASADAFTESVSKGDSIWYRARFAGLGKEQAEAACNYLKHNNVDCMTIQN